MYERIKWRIQKETRANEIRNGGIFQIWPTALGQDYLS